MHPYMKHSKRDWSPCIAYGGFWNEMCSTILASFIHSGSPFPYHQNNDRSRNLTSHRGNSSSKSHPLPSARLIQRAVAIFGAPGVKYMSSILSLERSATGAALEYSLLKRSNAIIEGLLVRAYLLGPHAGVGELHGIFHSNVHSFPCERRHQMCRIPD